MARHTAETADEMKGLAHELLDELVEARVVLLSGDLGAGKTTFVQGVAQALGVNRPVRSPTYTLVNVHPVVHHVIQRLVHVDLYRLDRLEDVMDPTIGLGEFLNDAQSLVLIEWPERLVVPLDALKLTFTIDGERRLLEIKKTEA